MDFPRIDRHNLILDDLLLDSLEQKAEYVLRPWFENIWNAAGFERCYNYDDEGNWKPH